MSSGPMDVLREELKRSPGKAVVLLIGAVGAAVVWGPRLASGFQAESDSGRPSIRIAEDEAERDGIERRDPASIRAEFIKISEDARHLRVLAEPVKMLAPSFDPYAAAEYQPKPVEAPPDPPGPPGSEEPLPGEQDERNAALLLELTGVFQFKSGRSAVLSGEVLREGDQVAGLLVESIEPRAVHLRGRFGLYRVALDRQEEQK